MTTLAVVSAGVVAGVAANATGFVITGRLFHRFQSRTPGTWRAAESSAHHGYAAAVRMAACIAVVALAAALLPGWPALGGGALVRGAAFGLLLWAATALPLLLESALFVNWHPAFVVGLLLDWLAVFLLAGLAGGVVTRAA